jgi:hypothetical protein
MEQFADIRASCLAMYERVQTKEYWLGEATRAIENFRAIKTDFPGRFEGCALEAAQEWYRLVATDRTAERDCDNLFEYASLHYRKGLPWAMFADNLARWMYSHGHTRGLNLSWHFTRLEETIKRHESQ